MSKIYITMSKRASKWLTETQGCMTMILELKNLFRFHNEKIYIKMENCFYFSLVYLTLAFFDIRREVISFWFYWTIKLWQMRLHLVMNQFIQDLSKRNLIGPQYIIGDPNAWKYFIQCEDSIWKFLPIWVSSALHKRVALRIQASSRANFKSPLSSIEYYFVSF